MCCSCASLQLVSTVAPIGRDSELLQTAGEPTGGKAYPRLCRMPVGPVVGTLPPQAGVLLTSRAGLAGTWCPQAAQTEPACQHVIWLFVYRTLCHLLQFPRASSSTCSDDTSGHFILTLSVNSNHYAPNEPAYSIEKC